VAVRAGHRPAGHRDRGALAGRLSRPDALEALGLIATGLLAARGDRRHALAAAATATLLAVDTWFDTTTAAPGGDLATAVAMALGAELPLAALCGRLALRALGRRA
jgi:hypothetical protein